MLYGVALSATGPDAQPLYDLWDKAAQLEKSPSMRGLNYVPHFTMAAYPDSKPDQLEVILDALFAQEAPLEILFNRLAFFDKDPITVWAAPAELTGLQRFHEKIHGAIDPALCNPYNRPDLWIPHCSVALKLPTEKRGKVQALVEEAFTPFTVTFDRIDCLTFPPVNLFKTLSLTG